MTLKVTDNQ